MPNYVITPNMSLFQPDVGVDPGPEYASLQNENQNILDTHDHSSGKGVQVTPAGINVNADLPVNGHNLTSVRSTRYTAQLSPINLAGDLGCTYVSGVDLWYNDENGNQIQLTVNGGAASGPGGISGLTPPASASYSALTSTFTFQSAANTPANLDFASAVLRNLTSGSHGLTLNPPAAMGADITETLPTPPASLTSIMRMDSAGLMTASLTLDGVSIVTSANVASVAAQAQAATNTDTTSVSVGSTTPTAISGSSVTFTATGRPVFVRVSFSAGFQPNAGAAVAAWLFLARASTIIDGKFFAEHGGADGPTGAVAVTFMDPNPGTGSKTYNLYATGTWNAGSSSITMTAYSI